MSIKFLFGLALGAAGGYSVGRIMEARAHGVPLDVAFSNLTTSIKDLSQKLLEEKNKLLSQSSTTTSDSCNVTDAQYTVVS